MPMPPFDKCSWSMSNKDEQLKRVRAATAEELRRMARTYDWSKNPEAVLGWMMAQKGMDLSSALVVFFNGDPGRFNYLSKKDVPQEFRGAARVLDNICLRMNSGFYRVRAGQKLPARAKLDAWLDYQRADRAEGRRGRWILDEGIIEAALIGKRQPPLAEEPADIDAIRPLQGPGAVQGFIAELIGPGLGARLQRMLPRRG
ncbi:hypothetical protein XM52_19615 [Roseovarius indicus]|uniref:DUF4274 domain-containing protein n=3 Tax=Roseovarius indicus TaxID=540747 RepID=A0A0T5P5P1_9RHOB|nr:hypothetical protein XM52_19615 [Roseovarius indicus]OAO05025.1 hypothetical protein A8B76_10885 [Roseovarius indicus]